MSNPLVRVIDVTRSLPEFRLGPVNLELQPGLVYALVGRNGSGKSTFFRMLMGQIRPDSGSIERFGSPLAVDDYAQAARIAYVPEVFTGHDAWKVSEINELYGRVYPNYDLRLAQQLQEGVDLHKRFIDLSKGMQRRAILGAALASQPNVLLVDEPTDGIDPFARKELFASFSRYMEEEDRSMLIATHNLEEVRRIADVVIVLENGEHLGTWEKDELLEGWQRLWFASEPARKLAGELERTSNGNTQVVTNNLSATLEDAQSLGLEVINTSPIDMVESLRIVIQKRGDRVM